MRGCNGATDTHPAPAMHRLLLPEIVTRADGTAVDAARLKQPALALAASSTLPHPKDPTATQTPGKAYRALILAAIAAGLVLLLGATLSGELFRPLRESVAAGRLDPGVLTLTLVWVGLGLAMLLVRTALWMRYRPAAAATVHDAPSMTVVIPAYNEGAMVQRSIDSVVRANYPLERLQIIVVDDGSTDDTWAHIEAAAARHPGRVTTLRLARNQGKRGALAAGFRAARGEILVTIDSDSEIERGTLLAVAGPFRDSKVGAVAGKVVALNRDQGWIPRMLHVRFVLSFDLQRSAQSVFRTVYCCPGALAAYRSNVVLPVLDEWLSQRFMGVACTYGEDRAMTNLILEQGRDTVYQSSAVVHTLVPRTYGQLCRMYLRWDRSHVREECRYVARTLWTRPLGAMLVSLVDKVVTNVGIPLGWAMLAALIGLTLADPTVLLRVLAVIGIGAAFSMLYYLHSERSLRFVHGISYAYFAFFGLWWVFPWAVLTVRNKSWMTR